MKHFLFETGLVVGVLLGLLSSSVRADLWGLSIDPKGYGIPVTDYSRVFRFDNDGNKLANDIGFNSAGLLYPTGIVVGPDDTIYVSSGGTGSILYFDGQTGLPLPSAQTGGPAGLFAFLGMAAPAQLAIGPDGNLYVSEYFGSSVRVYDVHPGPNFGQQLANAATGLTSAGGLAFTADGDLLVGDGFVMAPGQTAQIVRVHNGVQTTFTPNVSSPSSLFMMDDDSVLVADLVSNYILHFAADGSPLAPFASIPPAVGPPTYSNFPSDIQLDPDGNLVISILGATDPPDDRGALLRYDLNGNLLETIVSGIEPIGGIDWTTSAATHAGDYDGNGSIGAGDYARWRASFGRRVARGNGADGDANGLVDARDYVLWRKAAGISAGSALESSAVPEPATLVLAVVGFVAGLAIRSRRK